MKAMIKTVAALLLVVLGFAAPAQAAEVLAGIKGVDDRLDMVSHEYPWSAIGRINTETGGHCSGVLVGPDVVLTAAHCLYDKRKQWFVPPAEVHFVAGYFRKDDAYANGEVIYQETNFVGHSVAKNYYIPEGYEAGVPPTGTIAVNDWAFVILENKIGITSGWFGVANLDRVALKQFLETETPFVQAGYSKDKKLQLTAHINCPVEGFAAGLRLSVHRCDAVPGDSGSPIFYFEDGLPVLVAIHVATTQKQQPTRGVAVPSESFMAGIGELGLGTPAVPNPALPQASITDALPTETARTLLAYLGYTAGGDLERAVRRFETTEGMEITGEVSYNLIGRLVMALAQGR